MQTPILVIGWRRPEILRRLIASLEPVRPRAIYFACDGPRLGDQAEALKVQEVRQIMKSSMGAYCEKKYFFAGSNHGCRRFVSGAISWFFEHVDEGIILEDDCIPVPEFFDFMELMLSQYRYDSRVASVSGCNPLEFKCHTSLAIFSRYFECWGWGTWKRAWEIYDDSLDLLELASGAPCLDDAFETKEESSYWKQVSKQLIHFDKPSSWAYRFLLCSASSNMVHAISAYNLIENIGCGPDSTHSTQNIFIGQSLIDEGGRSHFHELLNSSKLKCKPPLPCRKRDRLYAKYAKVPFSPLSRVLGRFRAILKKAIYRCVPVLL